MPRGECLGACSFFGTCRSKRAAAPSAAKNRKTGFRTEPKPTSFPDRLRSGRPFRQRPHAVGQTSPAEKRVDGQLRLPAHDGPTDPDPIRHVCRPYRHKGTIPRPATSFTGNRRRTFRKPRKRTLADKMWITSGTLAVFVPPFSISL